MKLRNSVLLFSLAVFCSVSVNAQPKPAKKTNSNSGNPSQAQMDKMLEDAMKAEGMSKEEQAEMKKMMGGIMPDLMKKPDAASPDFTNNRDLVPRHDQPRIAAVPKKIMTAGELKTYQQQLLNKLMLHISTDEKAIVTKAASVAKTGDALMSAAVTAFMQGHDPAAIALSLQALGKFPQNPVIRNNTAAILSQSGYGDKAIPILKQLAAEYPDNSTIQHNLGFAWLSLGETDTARLYFGAAARMNPENPETQLCGGLMEELAGDPIKAVADYESAFEKAPNPLAEKMLQNKHAAEKTDNIDFEKLKRMITIHEYFTSEWSKFPVLMDDVSHYENNSRIQNGFYKMSNELDDQLDFLLQKAGSEMDALVNQGEDEFVKSMALESIKGLNMLSKPATYILKILTVYHAKWAAQLQKESAALGEDLNRKRKEFTKSEQNDKCPDFDRKNNKYLQYANPLVRKFFAQKLEEYRVWLNAWCTWSWFVVGNPKNSVLTQCIGWARAMNDMRAEAVSMQEAIAPSCKNTDGSGVLATMPPVLPDFKCPTEVGMPIGMDAIRMSADAINLDANSLGISMQPGRTAPSVTLSPGIGHDITEPGKFGQPYFKVSGNSITPSGINELPASGTNGASAEQAAIKASSPRGTANGNAGEQTAINASTPKGQANANAGEQAAINASTPKGQANANAGEQAAINASTPKGQANANAGEQAAINASTPKGQANANAGEQAAINASTPKGQANANAGEQAAINASTPKGQANANAGEQAAINASTPKGQANAIAGEQAAINASSPKGHANASAGEQAAINASTPKGNAAASHAASQHDKQQFYLTQAIRKLLAQNMKKPCLVEKKKPVHFEVGMGNLEFGDLVSKDVYDEINQQFVKIWYQPTFTADGGELVYEDATDSKFIVGVGEVEFLDENNQPQKVIENKKISTTEVIKNGIQTVITNGIEAVQGANRYIRGLFN